MSTNRIRKLHSVPSESPPAAPRGGHVRHDPRGTAVWNWDIDTGVLAKKTVDELITTLAEPGELTLHGEPECDWAGDPYNRSVR